MILERSALWFPSQYHFIWCFFVNLNILSQKLEHWSSAPGEIRGHSLMTPTRKGKGDHKAWMVLREGGLTLLDVHLYMKQIFLSMISEDILIFFASHLFYCFLEETRWRDTRYKEFYEIWSEQHALVFLSCFYTYETFEHCVPII